MSDLKNGAATAALIADNTGPTLEERLQASRERYSTAIADALNAELEQFLLPTDKAAMLEDAFAFTGFVLTTMLCEQWMQQPTGKNLVKLWGRIHKEAGRSVPESLLLFAKAAEAESSS